MRPSGSRQGAPGLTGREQERGEVLEFLRGAVRFGGTKEVLYVSGMPGTGKTASVLEAVRALDAERRGLRRPFVFAHVNAMCLSSPGAVFGEICRKLPEARRGDVRTSSESQAHSVLSRYFGGGGVPAKGGAGDREVVVLLLDEIDCLVTQAQTVLYRLFDWLSLPSSRLVVVAIANTMDLPERLLPRVTSRLGVRRVNFAPYSRAQLRQILQERLRLCKASGALTEDALTLCSARIAASSGDARKAMQVCRRALEARLSHVDEKAVGADEGAFEDGKGPITVSEISSAEVDLLRANPAARVVSGLSLKARRLLLAFVLELRRRPGASALPWRAVAHRYEGLMLLCERAASSGTAPDVAASVVPVDAAAPAVAVLHRHAEDAMFCLRRLVSMAVLRLRDLPAGCDPDLVPHSALAPADGSSAGATVELGEILDADDVADALLAPPPRGAWARDLAAEEDVMAKELLGAA